MKQVAINFSSGDDELFGWLHSAENKNLNCGVVICNPFGYEYAHAHRSVRHLAKNLAEAGVPTLRFDFHGIGNSSGSDLDQNRIDQWLQDIRSAIIFLQKNSKCETICLIGLKFGGTLAALVSRELKVDLLVLWNPVVNGRRYIREIQAIAMSAQVKNQKSDMVDVAGIVMTAETIEQIKKINLLEEKFNIAQKVLILNRDDFQNDLALMQCFKMQNILAEELISYGDLKMMDEPQFNVVPEKTIQDIINWVTSNSKIDSLKKIAFIAEENIQIINYEKTLIKEQSFYFGLNKDLFGIYSYVNSPSNRKPTVVLLNSGSVHHVGPHRLYVSIARSLTTMGFNCLRMDFHGLGESGLPDGYIENNPYPSFAVSNVKEALSFLKSIFDQDNFILLGLCSGAHAAFHAAIESEKAYHIADTILINPLTYKWVEGMSLETTDSTLSHMRDVSHYKNNMSDPEKWKKLIKGKIQFMHVGKLMLEILKRSTQNLFRSTSYTELSIDLKKLLSKSQTLTLFVAMTDPGYDLLVHGAKNTLKQGLQSGKIQANFIKDADHTFSNGDARRRLINQLKSHLMVRWP